MIYKLLVISREIAMMRTNRKVREEMQGMVDAVVPYRLYVNHPRSEGRRVSLPEAAIQRLEVFWAFRTRPVAGFLFEEDKRSVQAFGEVGRSFRKQCVVYLELCVGRTLFFTGEEVQAWRCLVGLEEVRFRVLWREAERDGRGLLASSGSRQSLILQTVGQALESAWGGFEHGSDGEGEYICLKHGQVSGLGREDGESVDHAFKRWKPLSWESGYRRRYVEVHAKVPSEDIAGIN